MSDSTIPDSTFPDAKTSKAAQSNRDSLLSHHRRTDSNQGRRSDASSEAELPPRTEPPILPPVRPASSVIQSEGGARAESLEPPLAPKTDRKVPPRVERQASVVQVEQPWEVEPPQVDAETLSEHQSPITASPEPSESATSLELSLASNSERMPKLTKKRMRWYQRPIWLLGRTWDFVALLVLLAVVAAIPLIQLASLGYLLTAAANLAAGRPWSSSFPGLRVAGKLATFVGLAALFWLPVWLITDVAYSAQLLLPGSSTATGYQILAFVITGVWMVHVAWAALRGGRWWHLLWPAPIKFFKTVWRRATWSRASDELYEFVAGFQFPRLWWLGARAAVGALLWITLPVSLMIIGQRAEDLGPAGLIGFVGAAAMTLIMLYLPFLQIEMARTGRFVSLFAIPTIRRRFRFAPWAHTLALFLLCLLCIPLYLLRIEATPEELTWAPALVFVFFMLPAKILLGAAMGYGDRRAATGKSPRHWSLRWLARPVALASVLVYVGALYVAQLVAGQGAFVMYFQHAFLVPAPQF
ncbi:MAG: hypothetical protein AB8B50_10500 [Pirellulaceae bacterium]